MTGQGVCKSRSGGGGDVGVVVVSLESPSLVTTGLTSPFGSPSSTQNSIRNFLPTLNLSSPLPPFSEVRLLLRLRFLSSTCTTYSLLVLPPRPNPGLPFG